jgi:hypothetical protein
MGADRSWSTRREENWRKYRYRPERPVSLDFRACDGSVRFRVPS